MNALINTKCLQTQSVIPNNHFFGVKMLNKSYLKCFFQLRTNRNGFVSNASVLQLHNWLVTLDLRILRAFNEKSVISIQNNCRVIILLWR